MWFLLQALLMASLLICGLESIPQTHSLSECKDNLATSACVDIETKGSCSQHGTTLCKKTCGLCTSTGCKDDLETASCRDIKADGNCQVHGQRFCKKTCGICSSADNSNNQGIESCGTSTKVNERIASGRPAITGEYPWMVHFNFFSEQLERIVPCGGSLITRRWVLTAAHCFRFLKPNVDLIAKIGFVSLRRHEPGALLFSIDHNDIFRHNEFSETTLVNDIALVRMPDDVTFSNIIQPICLGTNQQIPFGGQAYAAGWGLLKSSDLEIPDLLHDVQLNVLPEKNCTSPEHFICTSTPGGKDTCNGDSGGPLMVQQDNQWYQVGIVSHGPTDCGSNNYPASYTRVPNYLPFINNLIRN